MTDAALCANVCSSRCGQKMFQNKTGFCQGFVAQDFSALLVASSPETKTTVFGAPLSTKRTFQLQVRCRLGSSLVAQNNHLEQRRELLRGNDNAKRSVINIRVRHRSLEPQRSKDANKSAYCSKIHFRKNDVHFFNTNRIDR